MALFLHVLNSIFFSMKSHRLSPGEDGQDGEPLSELEQMRAASQAGRLRWLDGRERNNKKQRQFTKDPTYVSW